MKKIVLISWIIFFFIASIKCAEPYKTVAVGVFSHKGFYQSRQNNRWDIKKKGDAIGVSVFAGYGGRKISTICKMDFFDDYASKLDSGESIENALKKAIHTAEVDSWDSRGDCSMMRQGSSVLASWFDFKSNKGHLIFVGDSVGILIGRDQETSKLQINMTLPHRIIDNEKEKKRIQDVGFSVSILDKTNKVSRLIGKELFKSKYPDCIIGTPDYYSYSLQSDSYLILITASLYNVLKSTTDEERYEDFEKIFIDVCELSDKKFNAKYFLLDNMTMKSEEESNSEESDDELFFDLKEVEQDNTMQKFAKRLVQVALSRGCKSNITVAATHIK